MESFDESILRSATEIFDHEQGRSLFGVWNEDTKSWIFDHDAASIIAELGELALERESFNPASLGNLLHPFKIECSENVDLDPDFARSNLTPRKVVGFVFIAEKELDTRSKEALASKMRVLKENNNDLTKDLPAELQHGVKRKFYGIENVDGGYYIDRVGYLTIQELANYAKQSLGSCIRSIKTNNHPCSSVTIDELSSLDRAFNKALAYYKELPCIADIRLAAVAIKSWAAKVIMARKDNLDDDQVLNELINDVLCKVECNYSLTEHERYELTVTLHQAVIDAIEVLLYEDAVDF